VFWKSSTEGSLVYNWAEDDVLKAYQLSSGKLVTTPYMQGQAVSPGHPGGSNWNNGVGASSTTPLALKDETGTLTSRNRDLGGLQVVGGPNHGQPGNVRMMRGYLDTSSTSVTSLTVEGLVSNTYDVYVYADGDNRTFARTAAYTISGPGFSAAVTVTDPARVNFSGTFAQAANSTGNYVKFRITDTGFTISAKPLSSGNTALRAPINGFQIVAAGVQA
jgi:hypothetical protein